MKKFRLLFVALISVLSLSFVSCEVADDDSIVGSWSYSDTESYDGYTFSYTEIMTFSSDGDLTMAYTFTCYDENGDVDESDSDVDYGTYVYDDNLLTVFIDGESITVGAVISGDRLVLTVTDDGYSETVTYTRL